jgi:hypothetical protein
MQNCYFKDQFLLNIKRFVKVEPKLKILVYWFNSEIKTNPIFLFYFNWRLHILWYFNTDIWIAGLNY